MQSDPIENIFARAWTLLIQNPIIIAPGIVVGILVGLFQALLITPRMVVDAGGGDAHPVLGGVGVLFSAALSLAVSVLAFLLTQTYTTGMAGAAWQNGRTSLADGSASFREDAGRLLAAMLLLAAVGIVAAIITLGIGWFVVLFFAMYLIPAVVLDNFGAIPAFRRSAAIATRRVLATIIIIVMLFVIGLAVGLLALPLAVVPLIGPIVLAIASQSVTAYATLVIVGEYLAARRSPDLMTGPVI